MRGRRLNHEDLISIFSVRTAVMSPDEWPIHMKKSRPRERFIKMIFDIHAHLCYRYLLSLLAGKSAF
jgi:hypothetical protein